jgi:hypothetical protein
MSLTIIAGAALAVLIFQLLGLIAVLKLLQEVKRRTGPSDTERHIKEIAHNVHEIALGLRVIDANLE